MSEKRLMTSWIWAHEGGMQGANLDLDAGLLRWYDNPGCACDDDFDEQPFDDFLRNGPIYIHPPEDVLEEMRAALEAYRVR